MDQSDAIERRLLIVEGIVGSGKSTTTRFIAASLEKANRRARPIPEATMPHPTRVFGELPHPYQPWLDVTPAELAEQSLSKWRSFVDAARAFDTVSVLDGQLFHGDLTNLFFMEAGRASIAEYSRAVEEIIRPLNPLLIYLYQEDIERASAAMRG